ncbi:MAG: hypothetical protein MUE36_00010 [Acidimicrobiales bacterium]|jgi:uncharacterized membrane protein|nr:hypothetical protein [Acidimicrobiales bacterium]
MFAELGSTPYNIMLLFHVLLMVVAFAPAWLTPVLVRQVAGGDTAAADALEVSVLRYSVGALAVAGLLGFGLAGLSKPAGSDEPLYSLSQTWLLVAVLLWLILLAVNFFVTRPAIKAFRDGDAKAKGAISAGTGVSHLILVASLYLMIWKPGV